MTKINRFNSTIMYIGQNEKWTLIGIEPRTRGVEEMVAHFVSFFNKRSPTQVVRFGGGQC